MTNELKNQLEGFTEQLREHLKNITLDTLYRISEGEELTQDEADKIMKMYMCFKSHYEAEWTVGNVKFDILIDSVIDVLEKYFFRINKTMKGMTLNNIREQEDLDEFFTQGTVYTGDWPNIRKNLELNSEFMESNLKRYRDEILKWESYHTLSKMTEMVTMSRGKLDKKEMREKESMVERYWEAIDKLSKQNYDK